MTLRLREQSAQLRNHDSLHVEVARNQYVFRPARFRDVLQAPLRAVHPGKLIIEPGETSLKLPEKVLRRQDVSDPFAIKRKVGSSLHFIINMKFGRWFF